MGTASTKKFIKNNAGQLTEEAALTTSAGAADANKIPALNASGILDDTILNATVTASASKIVKLNASGILDDTVLNATVTASANKIPKLNASGILDDTVLNATATSTGAGSAAKVVKLNASGLVDDTALNATVTSAGAGSAAKVVKLNASGLVDDTALGATVTSAANKIVKLDASGKLDSTVLPTGIGADTASIVASEALTAGDLVNIWSNAGVANMRKADGSTTGKEAHGFVLAAVASSAAGTCYFEGTNTQCTGLTPGLQFLSSTTAGKTTVTAPSTAGQIVQRVGYAISATAMNFDGNDPIVLA
jgi:hypothetical protein